MPAKSRFRKTAAKAGPSLPTREALSARLSEQPAPAAVIFAEPQPAPPPMAYCTRFPRLSVVLEGVHHEQVGADGEIVETTLKPGDAIWIPADHWNLPAKGPGALVMSFLFGFHQVGLSLIDTRGSFDAPAIGKFTLRNASDPVLQSIVQAIVAAGPGARQTVTPPLVAALLRRTARLLTDDSPVAGGKGRQTYEALCLHVQHHLPERVSRESVAEHFKLTPTHVSRLFRQHGGMTFSRYLGFVRVNRAKYLMTRHDVSLKEVARACGFADQPHFNRVFLSITKTTPTTYLADRRQGV